MVRLPRRTQAARLQHCYENKMREVGAMERKESPQAICRSSPSGPRSGAKENKLREER